MESKLSFTPEQLCQGLSYEFVNLLEYARDLEFEEKPDYKNIKIMFKNSIIKSGGAMDWKFDWHKNKKEEDNKEEEEEKSKKSEKEEKSGKCEK